MAAKKHSGGRPRTGQKARGVQVEIPHEEGQRLAQIAQMEGRTMRSVVIRALALYREERERKAA